MSLLYIDNLSIFTSVLVLFVATNVSKFSFSYMKGDKHFSVFIPKLIVLALSIVLMISANHLVLFLTSWIISNTIMTQLMVHKKAWHAAKMSGVITRKTFFLSLTCMACAFICFYMDTHSLYIQDVFKKSTSSIYVYIGTLLLTVSAFIQSANWPFHKWLISSLNSPTPVSAIMHAGIINGGALIITRFSPLYISLHGMLLFVFIIGTLTAILGSSWKLVQTDIKRTLACSTLAQMGFMLMQCGLGLFPEALAHICWHGLFKAYLFLNSASTAKDRVLIPKSPLTLSCFILSLISGAIGWLSFCAASNTAYIPQTTAVFVTVLVGLTCAHLTLSMRRYTKNKAVPLILSAVGSTLYGLNIQYMDTILSVFNAPKAQEIHWIHMVVLVALIVIWSLHALPKMQSILPKSLRYSLYIKAINASQPHPETITKHHNNYRYT